MLRPSIYSKLPAHIVESEKRRNAARPSYMTSVPKWIKDPDRRKAAQAEIDHRGFHTIGLSSREIARGEPPSEATMRWRLDRPVGAADRVDAGGNWLPAPGELMQERGLSHGAAQRQAEREMKSSIAAAHRNLQRSIADQNAAIQRQGIETSLRVAELNAQSRINSVHQTTVDRINANTDIPSDARQRLLDSAAKNRDRQLSLTEQATGVKRQWTTAGRTSSRPAATPRTTAPARTPIYDSKGIITGYRR